MFFFSSRRRHTRYWRDWSSDVCSSDLRRRPPQDPAARSRRLARGGVGLVSTDRRLVLAFASPARLSLLRQAGLSPEVVVSGVDEGTVRAPRVAETVALLAAAQAAGVAKRETDALVIGAQNG